MNKVASLISTLTKAEKRYFKLYSANSRGSDELLFVKLFDSYDQNGQISDEKIIELEPGIKKDQLPNMRIHLYNKLLTSLRLQNQKSSEDIEIRQQIDFAKVLYDKGLYSQALDILSRSKKNAISKNKNVLALEILFFEKAIESQNITKSIGNRSKDLISKSNQMLQRVESILNYSNLTLELYSYFLKNSFCKSESDLSQIEDAFSQDLPAELDNNQDFYSKFYYCQSLCWYYYIRQDFEEYFNASLQWLTIFDDQEIMMNLRPELYLKAIHNVIGASFILLKVEEFNQYFTQLKHFLQQREKEMTWNEIGMAKLYISMHEIDNHFLTGNFAQFEKDQPEFEQILEQNPYHWDAHRLSVFHYKLGCLAFGRRNYETAIDYFNRVGQHYKNNSNSMVFLFSKILLAFAHLQSNHLQLVDSMVQALQKDLNKNKRYRPLERELVRLLNKLCHSRKSEHSKILQQSLSQIKLLEQEKFTKIAFLHFYAIEWIQSQLQDCDAQDILAEKYEGLIVSEIMDESHLFLHADD